MIQKKKQKGASFRKPTTTMKKSNSARSIFSSVLFWLAAVVVPVASVSAFRNTAAASFQPSFVHCQHHPNNHHWLLPLKRAPHLGEGRRLSTTIRVCVKQQRFPSVLEATSSSSSSSSSADSNKGTTTVSSSSSSSSSASFCWNPKLRRTLAAIASVGVLETAYLTYAHVTSSNVLFCTETAQDATCQSVLMGPYSVVPGTDNLPLATLGLLAYSAVAVLAFGPTIHRGRDNNNNNNKHENFNRIALVAVTTAMGVFSAGLLTILLGVLHTSCVYCVTSAILSLSLAKLSWLGGVAPKERLPSAVLSSLATSAAAVALAVAVWGNVEPATASPSSSPAAAAASLAAATSQPSQQKSLEGPYSPPPITTTSSPEALQVARQLQQLDTHFYGAYWCSHCYEQKQTLGKQAMQLIPYIECSKEGMNAQTALCRDKHIPGYPTWEVAGTLYPGEQALEELQDIIVKEQAVSTNQ